MAATAVLAEMNQGHWLALILMVTGALVLRHAFRMRKEKDEFAQPPFKQRPSPPPPQSDAQMHADEDLQRVIHEAQHLRRVLADESDRHAARLETLIQRAEHAIHRLETLSHSDAAAAKSLDRSDGVDPLNRRIYEMADQGLPPVEIARNLNQQTGKVELVLALRPR